MSKSARAKLQTITQAEEIDGPEPISDSGTYPRYRPGEYEVRCNSAKVYRDPQFQRWVCRLGFRLFPEGGVVYAFLNLGNGVTPYVGRRSQYRLAWIIANVDSPRKRQKLSHRVFVDKNFVARIGDTRKRHDGREHPEVEIYSTVKEILKRTWP